MTKPLRVLHVPDTVGGQAPGLARAERELGLDSRCVALAASPFAYSPDEVVRQPGMSRPRFEWHRAALLMHALRHVDVIHFNFGRTILPARLRALDLPLLKRAGKAIFVTFQGDDARRGDRTRAAGGLSLPTAIPERYTPRGDREKAARVARFDRYADGIFYLNPDLAHSLPERATFVPYAHVDWRDWHPDSHAANRTPIVLHAPSDREVKGTSHVLAAVDHLRASGQDVDLTLVEGRTHDEARRLYGQADLAVDQLYAGWYGGFAVEAMALGVPVICHVRDEDLSVIPPDMRDALPILRATPESLEGVVAKWLSAQPVEREELSRRSRSFVEQWHDPRKIAERLADMYRRAVALRKRRADDRPID